MAEGLQLRHILSMMGVAGFMQWRQFPSRPRCYGTDWERVPGGWALRYQRCLDPES